MSEQDLSDKLPGMLHAAVASAIRETLADEDLTKRFWEQGYNQLQEHAVNNGSQWIGKRLMTVIVTAIVTTGLVWLVRTGALK